MSLETLERKCFEYDDPNLVPANYATLFTMYRKKNLADIKAGRFLEAKDRIAKILQLDSKMLSEIYDRCRINGVDRFTIESGYTKITITDLKHLDKCAKALKDARAQRLFEDAREEFKIRKGK